MSDCFNDIVVLSLNEYIHVLLEGDKSAYL